MRADITFTLVTPCIMSGAKPKEAEMRIPSIRGQLQWWFRALGFEVDETLNIFGGVDKNRAVSSPFVVRDLTENLKSSCKGCEEIARKYDYFLWPLAGDRKRGVIDENQYISVKIIPRRVKNSTPLPEEVVKAFLLLGSLGTRSRRCYGSIYPVSAEINGKKWNIPTSMNEFKNELQLILDKYSDCYVMAMSDSAFPMYKSAINCCSDFLKKFRCGKDDTRFGQKASCWGKNDHDASFGNVNSLYRPELGLPLKTKYYEIDAGNDFDGEKIERLASPIHFKIIKLVDGYWPIAVFFRNHSLSNYTDTVFVKGDPMKVSNELFFEMMLPDDKNWAKGFCIGDFRNRD